MEAEGKQSGIFETRCGIKRLNFRFVKKRRICFSFLKDAYASGIK